MRILNNVEIPRSKFMIAGAAFASALSASSLRYVRPSEPVHPGRRFSVSEQRSDLRFLWNSMLAVGPDPFRTSNRATVEAEFARLLRDLREPLTSAELVFKAASVFALLNDGHVQIGPSAESLPIMSFPLILSVYLGKRLIVEHGPVQIPIASEVLAINGISATTIAETATSLVGAQTPQLRWKLASTLMYFTLAMLLGDGTYKTYEITWREPGGIVRTKSLHSPHLASEGHNLKVPRFYKYSKIGGGRIGLIEYFSCEDKDRFTVFIDDVMRDLAIHDVRTLIIDLRSNLGGDSSVSDVLLSRIAHTSFKQYGGTIVRSSKLLKLSYGKSLYTSTYGEKAWSAADGSLVQTHSGPKDLIQPATKLRFDGRVFMLIGAGTFSSGMTCAAAAKDYNLATLLGEETGEPMNSTGEAFFIRAPRTATSGLFTTKLFLAPKPVEDRIGVRPDVNIVTTLADRATGRDSGLEYILRHAMS